MGFFDIFKRKKPQEPEPEIYSISFSELPKFLDNKASQNIKEFKAECSEKIQELISQFSILKDKAKLLKQSKLKPDGDYPAKLLNISISLREQYYKDIENKSDISSPELTYNEIEKFIDNTAKILLKLDLPPQKASILIMCFGESMEQLDKQIQVLKRNLKELSNLFKKKGSILKEYSEIIDRFNLIQEIRKNISEAQEFIQLSNQKIKEHELKKNNIFEQLKTLVPEDIKEIEQQANFLRDQKILYDQKIDNLFSPFKRLFKKFKYASDTKNNDILNSYLKSPNKAFIFEDSSLTILTLLKSLEESINLGNINLDNKQKSKFLESKTNLTEERLKTLREEYQAIIKALEAKEKLLDEKIAPIKDKESLLKKELNELESKLDIISRELKNKHRTLEKNQTELQDNISELKQQILKSTNQDIEISF